MLRLRQLPWHLTEEAQSHARLVLARSAAGYCPTGTLSTQTWSSDPMSTKAAHCGETFRVLSHTACGLKLLSAGDVCRRILCYCHTLWADSVDIGLHIYEGVCEDCKGTHLLLQLSIGGGKLVGLHHANDTCYACDRCHGISLSKLPRKRQLAQTTCCSTFDCRAVIVAACARHHTLRSPHPRGATREKSHAVVSRQVRAILRRNVDVQHSVPCAA